MFAYDLSCLSQHLKIQTVLQMYLKYLKYLKYIKYIKVLH